MIVNTKLKFITSFLERKKALTQRKMPPPYVVVVIMNMGIIQNYEKR